MNGRLENSRLTRSSTLMLACLLVIFTGPTNAESGILEGCVCSVDKSTKSVIVFPWIKEKESWDVDKPQVLAYDPETKVIKAEFSLTLGEHEYKFKEDAREVPSLGGRRAIVKWVEREGRSYATEFQLIAGSPLGPTTLAAMVGGDGSGAESSMKKVMRLCVTCPCSRKSQRKR